MLSSSRVVHSSVVVDNAAVWNKGIDRGWEGGDGLGWGRREVRVEFADQVLQAELPCSIPFNVPSPEFHSWYPRHRERSDSLYTAVPPIALDPVE